MSKRKYTARIPNSCSGIRLQAPRSPRDFNWWTRRFLSVVESMCVGNRLGRGRNYAARGQIGSFSMDSSRVSASVMGARDEPYRVTLDFRMPDGGVRRKILKSIRSEPMTVARLLAGDLPLEVEESFSMAGHPLFPGGRISPGNYDMTCACSCPDYANPCKHVAAVFYVLAEIIDRDPFVLLSLRGFNEEELLA